MKLGKKKSNRVIPVQIAEAQKDMDPNARMNGAQTERAPLQKVQSEQFNDFHEVGFEDFNEPVLSHRPQL